jgi:2-keto-myo-inositol isomerase
MNRRQAIATLSAATAASFVPFGKSRAEPAAQKKGFRFCLNTSTISGQKLSLVEQVAVAATAGYNGIEPWISDLRRHQESGGSLDDVRRQIADAGMTVESAIGFAPWIVDDDAARAAGLDAAARDMQLVRAIGGTRIAAPPVGATGAIDLWVVAERYHALLEVGRNEGVVPQLELWGHSPAIHKLGQLVAIATEAAHDDACLLPDVYHIYKGGSSFAGLALIAGARMHVFHINDYPADPPRASIGDADRVYPGDGIAPLATILSTLRATGFSGALSLELFNRDYWRDDALEVAKTGLAKMRRTLELPAS